MSSLTSSRDMSSLAK